MNSGSSCGGAVVTMVLQIEFGATTTLLLQRQSCNLQLSAAAQRDLRFASVTRADRKVMQFPLLMKRISCRNPSGSSAKKMNQLDTFT